MKVLNTIWFSGGGTMGISLVENDMGEKKAYISIVDGSDAEKDTQRIMDWGAKLLLPQAKEIYDHLSPETVTMPKGEYDQLQTDSDFLRALEAAGVDNWDGYGIAHEIIDDEKD